jgi:hypothetical protein
LQELRTCPEARHVRSLAIDILVFMDLPDEDEPETADLNQAIIRPGKHNYHHLCTKRIHNKHIPSLTHRPFVEQAEGYEHCGYKKPLKGLHHIACLCERCVLAKFEARGWKTDARWAVFMKRIDGKIKLAKARRNKLNEEGKAADERMQMPGKRGYQESGGGQWNWADMNV